MARPRPFQLEAKSIPTVLDVLAMLEFRISLESEAAALAAARRTDEQLEALRRALDEFQDAQRNGGNGAETDFQFHLRIAEASGNRYFPEVFAHFGMSTIPRTRVTLFKSAEDQAAFISMLSREHEQIYGAILCGDPKLAAKFMRIHLSNSRDRFRKAQEQAAQTSYQLRRSALRRSDARPFEHPAQRVPEIAAGCDKGEAHIEIAGGVIGVCRPTFPPLCR